MRENALKRKLQSGEFVIGPFMNCSYGAFIEIVGMAGFDYAIIDMEHGPLEVETAEDLCRAAQGVGLSPIVRVRKNDAPQIQRALDIGSAGVQVPQIETGEGAEAVVRAAKYAPLGMRGLSFYTRAGDYTMYGVEGYTDRLNDEQLVIIHVEGVTGLQNLDAIIPCRTSMWCSSGPMTSLPVRHPRTGERSTGDQGDGRGHGQDPSGGQGGWDLCRRRCHRQALDRRRRAVHLARRRRVASLPTLVATSWRRSEGRRSDHRREQGAPRAVMPWGHPSRALCPVPCAGKPHTWGQDERP